MHIRPKNVCWAIATLLLALSPLISPTAYDTFSIAAATIPNQKAETDLLLKQCKQDLENNHYEAGLRSCHESLIAFQKLQNLSGITKALMNLGKIHASLLQYDKAVIDYQQALAIFQQLNDRNGEAQALTQLGRAYLPLSEYEKAITHYQQALSILQEVKDNRGQAMVLAGLGAAFWLLSEYQQTLTYYQKALSLFQEIKDRNGEAQVLTNLGILYNSLSQHQKAIAYFHSALSIFQQVKYDYGQAVVLLGLGDAYNSRSQYEKALIYYQQALLICQQIKNLDREAYTLNGLGTVYQLLSKYEKASDYYQQALAIFMHIKYRHGKAVVLSNIGELREKQNQPELAIAFYKQAVNVWESIRVNLHTLPKELQESYIQSVADTYRVLANLLLQQGRILEAQQVLELLKVQEIREFTREVQFRGPATGLSLTPAEQKILDQHGTLIAFSQKVYDCKKDAQHPCAELGQLNQQLYLLNQQYTQAVQSFEREIRDRKDPEMVDPGKLVAQAKPIVEAEPGTLLIYPLVLEDKTWLLWVARGGVVKSVEIPISRQQLGEVVVNFRNLVQDRRSTVKQVQAAGKRLYEILFQSGTVPLATEIQQNQIRHLVFALDRVTRYIPIAALYDGQHYLNEQYTVSTVIAAGLTNVDRLPSNPKSNPVLALGVSESVENLAPLEHVPQELQAIVQQSTTDAGIYPGQTFLNRDFNQQTLLTHLLGHTFLHIATHAAFLPNNPADSFILMGTGKLTIPQIRSLPDLASVQMVVLSACETALGGPDQDGIEISGISSYFLNSGVETVIASLWSVNDASTSLFMQQFYQNLATGTMTKAEALRQAQLSLLKGKVTGSNAANRADVEVREEAGTIAGQPSHFSHPYYWAPFILIGNRL